jgi:predicted ATPase with chaperone activity
MFMHSGGADLLYGGAHEFSYLALLLVAWTLADLAEADRPTAAHVAAALEFRERRAY